MQATVERERCCTVVSRHAELPADTVELPHRLQRPGLHHVITTSPTGADSGCSIATGVIVPREVVDSRGLPRPIVWFVAIFGALSAGEAPTGGTLISGA